MKNYFEENKLSQDNCALLTKQLQNKSITDYNLYNSYVTSTCDDKALIDYTLEYPNLRWKDGFGNVSGCTVDKDSEIRNNAKLTNFREKEQLCTRWYQAVPNFGRGGLIPNVESRLILGEDTSDIRSCDIVSEKNFDRFIPLIGCMSSTIQNPENIILPFERGGKITRDYVRDDEYLKQCGFHNPDGKAWRRKEQV
jgi:hypothetical protein